MANLIKLLSLFKVLWDAIQWALSEYRAYRARKAEERRQAQDKAVDDAAKAKTPEEAFDAQERIVDNDEP